jgi:hypothetical protein
MARRIGCARRPDGDRMRLLNRWFPVMALSLVLSGPA